MDRLYRDPALVRFYDLDNEWGEDREFCLRLARHARSVLDLGCGTGALVVRLAEGREVVGADPAEAMLEIARERPGGDRVEWVCAAAQDLDLGRRFDLVVLTGHAFQVFLTEADQRAALDAIARHLAPEGRFVFDARSPAAEEWCEWTPELSIRRFEDPELGTIEAWNKAEEANGIVTYRTFYRALADGRGLSAESRIRFTPKETLEPLLEEAGLAVERWLGDWQGNDWTPDSPEIIPLGRLR